MPYVNVTGIPEGENNGAEKKFEDIMAPKKCPNVVKDTNIKEAQ